MTIPFTQYIRPYGTKRSTTYETTSHEQEIKARALLDAKAYFESEILQTGDVSLTCEIDTPDGETHTLAHEICPNGMTLIGAMEVLVKRAHENLINNSYA